MRLDEEARAEREIERLVRARLDRDAETIDPRPLFGKIQQSLGSPGLERVTEIRRRHGIRTVWKWAGAAAAAAAVITAVVAFLYERTALARGETVVREARQAHHLPIDRCYLVEIRRESSLVAELSPAIPQVRQTRLWTRGDRFWVESARTDQRWAWGRDEASRFWIAFGPHTAVRLDADEVPFWLNVYCDLHSLNFDKWLSDVLNRFELTRESKPGEADSSTIVVRAKARKSAYPKARAWSRRARTSTAQSSRSTPRRGSCAGWSCAGCWMVRRSPQSPTR